MNRENDNRTSLNETLDGTNVNFRVRKKIMAQCFVRRTCDRIEQERNTKKKRERRSEQEKTQDRKYLLNNLHFVSCIKSLNVEDDAEDGQTILSKFSEASARNGYVPNTDLTTFLLNI